MSPARHLEAIGRADRRREAAHRRALQATVALRERVAAAMAAGVPVADIADTLALSTQRVYAMAAAQRKQVAP